MGKKRFKAVELNRLDENTALKIREWRNQDFVRKSSLTQGVIDEDTHKKWLSSMRANPDRYLFVCYLDEEPFGVIQLNYDRDLDSVESGEYLISEDFQAMGYGTILQFFENRIVYETLGFLSGHGWVLVSNDKNMKMQKRYGSIEGKEMKTMMINGKACEAVRVDSTQESWKQRDRKRDRLVYRLVEETYEVVR